MIIHKCDRCGVIGEVKAIPGDEYEFCDKCYDAFLEFMNERVFTPEEVWSVLVHHGQSDIRFRLGDTIMYNPSEVMEILKGVQE